MAGSNTTLEVSALHSKFPSNSRPVTDLAVSSDVARNDAELIDAISRLDLAYTVFDSLDSVDTASTNQPTTAFVIDTFSGQLFSDLQNKECTIFGRTAIKEMADCTTDTDDRKPTLLTSTRPLYSTAMRGVYISFSGYRSRDNKHDLKRFLFYIHSMGGKVLPDVKCQRPKVTHLVANRCRGEQYTYATTFDIPVMQDAWIESAWARRNEVGFSANDSLFMKDHQIKPFHGAKVHFIGFDYAELRHVQDELVSHGGTICSNHETEPCTHIVIEASMSPDKFTYAVNQDATESTDSAQPVEKGQRPSKSTTALPPPSSGILVVKSDWFWASIQIDASADENLYLFIPIHPGRLSASLLTVPNDLGSTSASTSALLSDSFGLVGSPNGGRGASSITPSKTASIFSPNTPGSHSKRKKRRNEAVRQLAQTDQSLTMSSLVDNVVRQTRNGSMSEVKTRNSIGFAQLTDDSGVLMKSSPLIITGLDEAQHATASPSSPQRGADSFPSCISPRPVVGVPPTNVVSFPVASARRRVFEELLHTEHNYVSILTTIIDVFKTPLETDPKLSTLLNQTQIKIIFGNVPAILDVHSRMLKDFAVLLTDWDDDTTSVGEVLLRYSTDLAKAYPPFVNFFEDTKKTLEECDKTISRFHAFLKLCQSRPECCRQSLNELMIRPVQRLASISLLVNDMLKHTDKRCTKDRNHPDKAPLETALLQIKAVLSSVNEKKRQTENQVQIFEIFSDIDNCPPHLVSSNRSFICKADLTELGGSDELCSKGADVSLFLFSDVVEIVKRRRSFVQSTAGGVHPAGGNQSTVPTSGLGCRSPSTLSLKAAVSMSKPLASVFGSAHPTGTIMRDSAGASANGNCQPISSFKGRKYKHVELMSLASIRRVVDLSVVDNDSPPAGDGKENETIDETVLGGSSGKTVSTRRQSFYGESGESALLKDSFFTIVSRNNQELKERMFVFSYVGCPDDRAMDKLRFMNMLCRQIANTMCRADPQAYMVEMTTSDLGLLPSDLVVASKTSTRAGLNRVKKVFSFNRHQTATATGPGSTPTGHSGSSASRLSRAVSSMISPLTSSLSNSQFVHATLRGGGLKRQHTTMLDQGNLAADNSTLMISQLSMKRPNMRDNGSSAGCDEVSFDSDSSSGSDRMQSGAGKLMTPGRNSPGFPSSISTCSLTPSLESQMSRVAHPPSSASSVASCDRDGLFAMPRTPVTSHNMRRTSLRFLSNSLTRKF